VIEVAVNTETLARSTRGAITGELYLRRAEECFPDGNWSDFPVVVLAWWIDGLHKVLAGQSGSFVGHFMDGPYSFVVKVGAGSTAHFAWGKRDQEESAGDVDVRALQRSAVTAGQQVVAVCHARSWSSRDVESLEQAVARSGAFGQRWRGD
jgi:hypothetical protein